MFKYTRTAFSIIIEDIKKYYRIFKYFSLIVATSYYIYACFANIGNLVINIVLACISSIYFLLNIFIFNDSHSKKIKKAIKKGYRWVKLFIQLISLGISLYGIYVLSLSNEVKPISIILATLMIILWVIQFVFEIITNILERKIDLLLTAWSYDINTIKNPVNKVGNFFKKMKGEDIIEPTFNDKHLDILEKRMQKDKK